MTRFHCSYQFRCQPPRCCNAHLRAPLLVHPSCPGQGAPPGDPPRRHRCLAVLRALVARDQLRTLAPADSCLATKKNLCFVSLTSFEVFLHCFHYGCGRCCAKVAVFALCFAIFPHKQLAKLRLQRHTRSTPSRDTSRFQAGTVAVVSCQFGSGVCLGADCSHALLAFQRETPPPIFLDFTLQIVAAR